MGITDRMFKPLERVLRATPAGLRLAAAALGLAAAAALAAGTLAGGFPAAAAFAAGFTAAFACSIRDDRLLEEVSIGLS